MSTAPYRSVPPLSEAERPLNPSRFRLPQRCSPDRLRGREALLRQRRRVWRFTRDTTLPGSPAEGFRLPNYAATLPSAERFTVPKLARLMSHKLAGIANFKLVSLLGPWSFREAQRFTRVFRLFPGPDEVIARWRTDEEFGRQRLNGVNPMAIRRCVGRVSPALAAAAAKVLDGFDECLGAGKIYVVDHSQASDARIQSAVDRQKRILAAPTALFHVDGAGKLMPLAIQLRPKDFAGPNPVFTPRSPATEWLVAKTHFQAADANHHQGVSHLLETHLVTEAIAVAAARTLHPDHPLSHLFAPHFSFNLAIDSLAREDLLGPKGPIETAMVGGVSAVLDRARMAYNHGWDFMDRSPPRDLKARGLSDVPNFHYRDDVLRLHGCTHDFVREALAQWYNSSNDVLEDTELQGFLREASGAEGAGIPGFPSQARTIEEVTDVVTEVIFRASVQHAAVNNGQFEAYGFIPNAPGSFDCPLPTSENAGLTEADWLLGLPPIDRVKAQVIMTWVLTEPTDRNFLNTGDAAAFRPEVAPVAARAVERLQFRLAEYAQSVESRNSDLHDRNDVPYWYLSPTNVSRSVDT